MDFETLSIGSSGIVQVKTGHDYMLAMREELEELAKRLMIRIPMPEGSSAYLRIKPCPHEFGTYLDLIVRYHPENEDDKAWALKLESADLEEIMKGWTPSVCPKCATKILKLHVNRDPVCMDCDI